MAALGAWRYGPCDFAQGDSDFAQGDSDFAQGDSDFAQGDDLRVVQVDDWSVAHG